MKLKILIISLLAIVSIAGCTIPGIPEISTGGGTLGGGNGLEITSFTAEPSSVFSGNTVRLIMETENKGGTNVANNKAVIYLTGSNFNGWGGTNYTPLGKEMKAEDVVRNIPADTKRFSWGMTAPALTAGQTRVDTFIGRLYHEYRSTANGNIWVYKDTEADAARTAKRELYRPSFTYTKGPVGLVVSVSPDPVILYGTEKNFTVYVKISNLATGTIYYPDAVSYTSPYNITLETSELNNVSLSINGDELDISGCSGPQELVAGRETTLVCDVGIKTGSTPETFKSYPLNVTVSYGYYTEKTASVTVQGRS